MKLNTLIEKINSQWRGDAVSGEVEISRLTYDSRQAQDGALFAALNGVHCRGTEFIAAAIKRGAVAVLGEDDLTLPVPYLQVANARAALAQLAAAFYNYPARHLKILGITGTNGKTTTAYLLRYLLNTLHSPSAGCGMLGTIEYDLGGEKIPAPLTTPESVDFTAYLAQSVAAKLPYVAAEISSHALALDRVVGGDFAAAIFTNLTRDHLDYHQTMENYAAAKQKLFTALNSTALAVVNGDDQFAALMSATTRARVVVYGIENSAATYCAKNIVSRIEGSEFMLQTPTGEFRAFVPLPGRHNIYNALAAIATLAEMQLPIATTLAALKNFVNVPGRLERMSKGGKTVFIDYAHTPDALANILQTVRPLTPNRLWLVFGCGGDRDRGKRPLMAKVAQEYADKTVVTSDNPRTENPAQIIDDIRAGFTQDGEIIYELDRAAAIKFAMHNARSGDTIIIAGKGHEDYQIVGTTKAHFSDKEVVTQLWN